jgi:hypothetical protein
VALPMERQKQGKRIFIPCNINGFPFKGRENRRLACFLLDNTAKMAVPPSMQAIA